jgi:acyl carrier protein
MDTLQTLKKLLKKLLPELDVNFDEITLENDLVKDLSFTSITTIMMAIAVEEEFGVQISQMQGDYFKTVGDVVSYIDKALED